MTAGARIHSLDSFGTHEGPGIRYVVFMQGCAARCRYCHNPDTWKMGEGRTMSAAEIFKKIQGCVPYFQASGGGVTASGGEPLLQAEFLRELFTLCRTEGIHTAIETAGFIPGRTLAELDGTDKPDGAGEVRAPVVQHVWIGGFEHEHEHRCAEHEHEPGGPQSKVVRALVDLTDLFLVDLKWADPRRHRELTGHDLGEPLALIEALERRGKPYWIRQVLAPGLNDDEASLGALKEILDGLDHCRRFEFLPYHTLGIHKWAALGLEYSLADARPATEEDITRARRIIGR